MLSIGSLPSRRASSFVSQRAATASSGLFTSPKAPVLCAPTSWRYFWTPPFSSSSALNQKLPAKPVTQASTKLLKRFYSRPNWFNDDEYHNRTPPRRAQWLQNLLNNWSLHPAVFGLLAANVGVGLLWMVRPCLRIKSFRVSYDYRKFGFSPAHFHMLGLSEAAVLSLPFFF
jgi:hypothetical protein